MNRYQSSKRNHTKSSDTRTILLFYVLPFILVNSFILFLAISKPKLEVTIADTTDYRTTTALIKIKSWLPTKNLTVAMDSEAIELTKTDQKNYGAVIHKNGVLEIYLENFNGMSNTVFEHINILDDNPPAVNSSSVEDGVLTIQLEDSQSGIDFNSIYGIDSIGAMVAPLSIDKSTASIHFNMDSKGLVIHAMDMSGNEVQASFKSHLEGKDEVLTDEKPTGAMEATETAENQS